MTSKGAVACVASAILCALFFRQAFDVNLDSSRVGACRGQQECQADT